MKNIFAPLTALASFFASIIFIAFSSAIAASIILQYGKNLLPNAIPLGNIPAVPTPVTAVIIHNNVVVFVVLNHDAVNTTVAPNVDTCEKKIATSGFTRRTDVADRMIVNVAKNSEFMYAAFRVVNPTYSTAMLYIHDPYVTSHDTERSMHAVIGSNVANGGYGADGACRGSLPGPARDPTHSIESIEPSLS